MEAENRGQAELEIGHGLFINIVSSSKLLTNEQPGRVWHLNKIVRETRSSYSNARLL
jgi:hypothetical protein